MTIRNPNIEDDVKRGNCDRAITAAARLLIEDVGASGEMVLDRMLTFAGAHAVAWTSAAEAATAFRHVAERIEAGAFAQIEAKTTRSRH